MIFISILILIVAIALPSINKMISPILFIRISSIVFIYAGVLSLNTLYIQSIGSGIGIYSGLFQVTSISQWIDTFMLFIGSFILVSWPNYSRITGQSSMISRSNGVITTESVLKEKLNSASEYSLIILFSSLGASLLVSSADLISMYLSIELQSFGVYILTTLYRDSESATSAGLKYFLLGCLSSCLILLGAGIIYTYTGLTQFESIYNLYSVAQSHSIIQGLNLGFIIILVGFLFKIAAAPLHNWAPDVYDNSTTLVTIWLTIMPKISIVIFILEMYTHIGYTSLDLSVNTDLFNTVSIFTSDFYNQFNINNISVSKNLLLLTSLFSLLIGTIVGLAQSKIKRLLAYSTISHVGFILLALAINTEQSIDSLIFYIVQYSLTNLNTFLILIALGYIIHKNIYISESINSLKDSISEGDIKYISELKGQFFANPLLALSLTICLFSMAGIPPLLGFFSKQFVLYSAMQSGYYFMGIVGILVSIISASYYLKIIRILFTEHSPIYIDLINEETVKRTTTINNLHSSNSIETQGNESPVSNLHSYFISALTLSILFFMLKPSILLNSTQLLALSLFQY